MNRRDTKNLFSPDPKLRAAARDKMVNALTPARTPNMISDSTGREIKIGHILHIPTNSIPNPVLLAEVVRVIEPSKLVNGPQQAVVVVAMHMTIPVLPDGKLPFSYIVGEVAKQPQPEPVQEEKPEPVSESKPDGVN